MAALRNSHVAHFLIALAACSSSQISKSGVVDGVLGVEIIPCDNGNCVDENVTDVVISGGQPIIARTKSQGGGSGINQEIAVIAGNFDDGGVTPLASQQNANEAYLAVAGDAGTFYVEDDQAGAAVHDLGTVSAVVGASGSLAGSFGVQGAVYFGLATTAQTQGPNSDPDSWAWPMTTVVDGGVTADERSGFVKRFDVATKSFASTNADFLMTLTHHVVVTHGTNVYWLAGPAPGAVMQAPMDLGTTPVSVGTLPEGIGSGVATNGKMVAWSTTSLASTPLCEVGTGSQAFFKTTAFACIGLAMDDTHAYFAVVSFVTAANNTGQTQYLAGTAIGRVSLAGPPTQTPSLVDVSAQRYYGPRRVLADDTYVYGVDPSYVIRVAKTAFK